MKMSQIDTENDKILEIFQILNINTFFVEVPTVFGDWNVLRVKQ